MLGATGYLHLQERVFYSEDGSSRLFLNSIISQKGLKFSQQ
jgi:hypothetical protein